MDFFGCLKKTWNRENQKQKELIWILFLKKNGLTRLELSLYHL